MALVSWQRMGVAISSSPSHKIPGKDFSWPSLGHIISPPPTHYAQNDVMTLASFYHVLCHLGSGAWERQPQRKPDG